MAKKQQYQQKTLFERQVTLIFSITVFTVITAIILSTIDYYFQDTIVNLGIGALDLSIGISLVLSSAITIYTYLRWRALKRTIEMSMKRPTRKRPVKNDNNFMNVTRIVLEITVLTLIVMFIVGSVRIYLGSDYILFYGLALRPDSFAIMLMTPLLTIYIDERWERLIS